MDQKKRRKQNGTYLSIKVNERIEKKTTKKIMFVMC